MLERACREGGHETTFTGMDMMGTTDALTLILLTWSIG